MKVGQVWESGWTGRRYRVNSVNSMMASCTAINIDDPTDLICIMESDIANRWYMLIEDVDNWSSYECSHTWIDYVGFSEAYRYCAKCSTKIFPEP